jgi:DNA 3'-phosphatase
MSDQKEDNVPKIAVKVIPKVIPKRIPKPVVSSTTEITKVIPTKVIPTKVIPTKVIPTKVIPTKVIPTKVIPTKVIPKVSKAEWMEENSCSYSIDPLFDPRLEIIAYDFDDTLVSLRTSVPLAGRKEVLQQQSQSYNIVVFSNQKGIVDGKTTDAEVRKLMDEFRDHIGCPISFLYASMDDCYRKPATGMISLLIHLTQLTHPILWYCGDAAGRRGDFNISDLYFANNAGIPFCTPEQVFNGKKYQPPNKIDSLYQRDTWVDGWQIVDYPVVPIIELSEVIKDIKEAISIPGVLAEGGGAMIIMVGAQGSGKSTVSNAIANQMGYRVINNDSSRSKNKAGPHNTVLRGLPGIVIDNTNTKEEIRRQWMELAYANGFRIVVVSFELTKPEVVHLTKYREAYMGPHIPMVAIHTTFKYYSPPTVSDNPYGDNSFKLLKYRGAVSKHPFDHRLRFTAK